MSKAHHRDDHHERPYCLDCGSGRISQEYFASYNGRPVKEQSILDDAATVVAQYIGDELIDARETGGRVDLVIAADCLCGVLSMLRAREEADAKEAKADKETPGEA